MHSATPQKRGTAQIRNALLVAASALALSSVPALADSGVSMQQLQAQIQALQAQLNQLQAAQAQSAAQAAQAAQQAAQAQAAAKQADSKASSVEGKTLLRSTKVDVTVGGFIEAAGIERNRNEGQDVGSGFNLGSGGNIPLPNSPAYNSSEFRGTARQSRLSLLANGKNGLDDLAAYFELDFLGAAPSANSKESNSYNPRIRHIYATYGDAADGLQVLAGQTWSLLVPNAKGIQPRTEVTPLTIDAQYVTGFTWARQPQLRVVKDFNNTVWAGLSIESPQASINSGGSSSTLPSNCTGYTGATPAGGCYYNQQASGSSGSQLYSGSSIDNIPDIVGKVAIEPGWGHYEIYGIGRFFTDRVTDASGNRSTQTNFGGGGGLSAQVPVVPKSLDLMGSFLWGKGIGRYGSAQFNDVVVNPTNGQLDGIGEVQALVGVIGHPDPALTLYAYGGLERVTSTDLTTIGGKTYGFGQLTSQGPCTEGLSCTLVAKSSEELTAGLWYDAYHGDMGKMRIGLSDSYSRIGVFGGGVNPNMNVIMTSFRYYPF